MLYTKTIKENHDYDIIVLGGGPAGCAAAAAAGRAHQKVLLIESEGCLGGMGTCGLVPAWAPFSDQEKVVYRGLAWTVFERAGKGLTPNRPDQSWNWVTIDPETLKRVYDDLMEENHVDVLFHSMLADCIVEENHIKALIISNKAGLTAFYGKVFIDTTGDADLAFMSGAPTVYGEETEDGPIAQPASLCFVLANVNMDTYPTLGNMHPHATATTKAPQMMEDPEFPLIQDKHVCLSMQGEGVVGFNAGHLFDVDARDPFSVSHAEREGRRLAKQLRDAMAKHCPEVYSDTRLVATASKLGVRESRRIVGEYVLNHEDYIARRDFDDNIGRNCYYLDIHGTKAQQTGKVPFAFQATRYGKGESHGIPYRSLLPLKIQNLLVAGRPISCDRAVMGSIRVMPTCLVTGEAAGVAAALALKSNNHPKEVSVKELQDQLLSFGCFLYQ